MAYSKTKTVRVNELFFSTHIDRIVNAEFKNVKDLFFIKNGLSAVFNLDKSIPITFCFQLTLIDLLIVIKY